MNDASGAKDPIFFDIMLDIETLGRPPHGVPWAVAMARFNRDTGEVGDTFDVLIDPVDAEGRGCRADVETAMFWVGQERAARSKLLMARKHGLELEDAMSQVRAFLISPERAARVWARPPAFDVEILKHACKCCGVEWPLDFWQDRCHRTLTSDLPSDVMAEIKALAQTGHKHVAMDDVLTQIQTLVLSERFRKTGRID